MEGPTIKPYKMSEIKSKLLRPALTSNFICEFKPPSLVEEFLSQRTTAGFNGGKYIGENQELIQLSCSEATLPGSSLMTHEINNDYTGVTERHAYRRSYDDRTDFTFYVDANYFVIDFFENWISYVVGENLLSAQDQTRPPQLNKNYNYRVNFPEQYHADALFITKFERDYDPTEPAQKKEPGKDRPLTYQFINAYPISIASMPVSYDNSQLLKCTVSFTYSRYVRSKNFRQFSSDPGNIFSPLNNNFGLQPLPGNIGGFSGAGFEGFAPPNVA